MRTLTPQQRETALNAAVGAAWVTVVVVATVWAVVAFVVGTLVLLDRLAGVG